jgi:hypothetical protein
MLSADLGGAIVRPGPAVLLVQIASAEPDGTLRVEVISSPRGTIPPGSRLRVPILRAPRELRARQGFNHWNKLDLSPGAWLALAGSMGDPGVFLPKAGRQSAPPETSEAMLRRAVGYAADPAGIALGPTLSLALAEGDSVAQSVLLSLAVADARLPRPAAVEGLAAVLAAMKPDDPMAEPVADALLSARLYDTDHGADPLNRRIIAALAAALLTGDAAAMAPFLRSALARDLHDDPKHDAALRLALIAAIPDRTRLLARLGAVGPEERERLVALLRQ